MLLMATFDLRIMHIKHTYMVDQTKIIKNVAIIYGLSHFIYKLP